MSPRSNDSNASSTKQKKKNSDSASSASVTQVSVGSSPAAPAPISSESKPAPASIESAPVVSVSATHDARAGFSAPVSASAAPRSFVASALNPVSTIETVTSTISSLSQHANRGISSLIAAHTHNAASPHAAPATDSSTDLRTDGSVSPIYDAFHNAGTAPDPARIDAALRHAHASEHAQPPQPRVLWSRWDRLPVSSRPLKCAPILISYFDDATLQVLLVQDRNITELLALPNAADVLLDRSASSSVHAPARLLTALVRPPAADNSDPQLLLVLQEPDNAVCLLAYSLTTHQVQASAHIQHRSAPSPQLPGQSDDRRDLLWPQAQAQCNHKYLVLSFAAPASIHVLSASNLEYLFPPLLDVSAPSVDRPCPFTLSNRLLAFACTTSKDVSTIRSDPRRIPSAALQDPSSPVAGIHSDATGRVGEMRDSLFETSAQVGDAARRIRGGVMTGVRTLGEWGSSYWPQAGSPPTAGAFSPPQPSLLSQSAPHTAAHPSRRTSSASSSPMLVAADGGRGSKRLSPGAPAGAGIAGSSALSAQTAQAGCVRVIDLGSAARTVCTFAPSNNSVAFVSFSPCGRLLLTADTLGHAFHVFEVPLLGTFGQATHSAPPSPVLHRYKLIRGITTADVVHAEWSPDAQWVAVGTHSGTVHVYAINPFGGAPSIANHVQGKVSNPPALQSAGLSLASLARSVRPSPPSQPEMLSKPTDTPTPATIPQSKAGLPSFILLNRGSRAPRSDSDATTPFELLTSDVRSASVTLHALRCWSTQARAPSSSGSTQDVHASTSFHKQHHVAAVSPRSSGLSQMMRKAGEGLLQSQQAPRLQAECSRVALWDQLSPEPGAVTKHTLAALEDHTSASHLKAQVPGSAAKALASVAKAEIETYSQSPAMLPSSIFLSRQTFFHGRTRPIGKPSAVLGGTKESLRSISRRGSRPIQVRRTARVVPREPSSETSSSFDDSLAGALDRMSFDAGHLPPRSASAHIPSFPQGQRGRSTGWTAGSSIPIRIVSSGLGGIYRAGKELGRGVEMARRRTSGVSAAGTEAGVGRNTSNVASISFEGEENVDLLGEDADPDRPDHNRYGRGNAAGSPIDRGSARSDLSLSSALRNDAPLRGSQPSSAETPSTRFSEGEDPSVDADECDWDTVEASRSPSAPVAPLFDGTETGLGERSTDSKPGNLSHEQAITSIDDDDFTVGIFEEDSGDATILQSRTELSPPQDLSSKIGARRELVYGLPSGGSTRSSLLSQSSGLTTLAENRADTKVSQSSPRDSSSSNSDGADSGSTGSGLLCEGGKVTQTFDSSLAAAADPNASDKDSAAKLADSMASAIKPPTVISTSGGGPKKKKKKGGR